MDRFEAALVDIGVAVVSQVATGSGSMVLYRLRVIETGLEFDLALPLETLVERPDQAADQVRESVDRLRGEQSNGGNLR